MNFNDYLQQGIKFFQEEKFVPALENLEAALRLQPDNTDVKQMVEMLKRRVNMAANANQALENEIKQRSAAMGITDIDKAIAEYSGDVSAKGKLASAYYIRGMMFASKGDHAKAIEDYNEAIKNEPEYSLAFNKRGRANLDAGNYDKAINDYGKLVQLNPNDEKPKQMLANAYLKRGIAYDKKSDYAHAISDFEMVLKYKPDDNTAHELLDMAKAEMAKK